jgi:hypothetical protein
MIYRELTKKKNIAWITFLGLFLILLFCIILIIDFSLPRKVDITNIDNENLVNWDFEEIQIAERYITVSGWAFIQGEDTRSYDINVVFKNVESGKSFEIPTKMIILEGLNGEFSDGINYSNNGFFAKINKILIKYEKGKFEIYIKYFNNDNQIFIRTNKIIGFE